MVQGTLEAAGCWRLIVLYYAQRGNESIASATIINMFWMFKCQAYFPPLHFPLFNLFPPSFGDWSQPQYCPSGVLTSFQISVEPHQGLFGDDTAVNNIRFRCSSNPTLEGPGMGWGEYGHWSEECPDGGICGIETKMEEYQYSLDDSTLNDVRFHCCASQQVRWRLNC